MNEKKYCVVFFDDNTSVVPLHWVDTQRKIVYWPNDRFYTKQQMLKVDVEDTWDVYRLKKFFGPFGRQALNFYLSNHFTIFTNKGMPIFFLFKEVHRFLQTVENDLIFFERRSLSVGGSGRKLRCTFETCM